MARHRPHQSHHSEQRYLVPNEITPRLREVLSEYLELDEYGVGKSDYSYPVHDFYLDSESWRIYWRMIREGGQSLHLRLRCYSGNPDHPIYVETKRATGGVVEKHSIAVPRAAIPWLLAGQLPDPSPLPPDAAARLDLERFCQEVTKVQAEPRVHVAFLREAWQTPDRPEVRVTIDRVVRCEQLITAELSPEIARPIPVYGSKAMLTLKFVGRCPTWFNEIVHLFNLNQTGAVEFVESVRRVAGLTVSGSDTTFF